MIRACCLLLCFVVAGCAPARTPDAYRTDVDIVLAKRHEDLKACYDRVLAAAPTAAGRVTVTFAVEEKTGRIIDPQLDRTQTTAPAAVGQCVLAALAGLSLAPADRKRGVATWSWDFAPQPAETASH